METSVTTGNETRKPRRKLNAAFIKIEDKKSIIARLVSISEPIFSRTYDSEFRVLTLEMKDGSTEKMVMDGGLKGALKLSKLISEQDGNFTILDSQNFFEIERNGTSEYDGYEVNTYNIYEA